jgi:uncharacterized lipoprotein NlpE involved in copper resistance
MGGDMPFRGAIAVMALLVAAQACAPLPAGAPQQGGVGAAAGSTPAADASAWAAATPRIDAAAAAVAYSGARTYSGVLSCAGCTPRRLTLTIFADGTFRLREGGVADGVGAPRYDIGRWSTSRESADMIVLQGDTQGARLFRRVLPDGLAAVDNDGREIRGLDGTTLPRAPGVDPLAGPLRLVGSYRREGEEAVFVECLTGRRLSLAAGTPASGAPRAAQMLADARSALDAAHRAVSLAPGDPVLAVVRGYLVPRVAPPGSPEKEALVVVAFERAMRDGRCEDVVPRKP